MRASAGVLVALVLAIVQCGHSVASANGPAPTLGTYTSGSRGGDARKVEADVQKKLRVLDIDGKPIEAYTFNATLAARNRKMYYRLAGYLAEGQYEEAVDALKESRAMGLIHNIQTHSNILTCCSNANQSDLTFEVFHILREEDLVPDTITYNYALTVLSISDQPERTLEVWRDMQEQQVDPNCVTYNAVIRAIAKSDHPEEALELLAAMVQSGIAPNTVTYQGVVNACERGMHSIQRALEVKEMLDDQYAHRDAIQQPRNYEAYIRACVNGSTVEGAPKVLPPELLKQVEELKKNILELPDGKYHDISIGPDAASWSFCAGCVLAFAVLLWARSDASAVRTEPLLDSKL